MRPARSPMSDHLPEPGTSEADEIEEIGAKLRERGYEMHVERQPTGWFAPLLRDNLLGPSSAPYGFGETAVDAARDAWRVYLKTPSISGYKPHPDDDRPD